MPLNPTQPKPASQPLAELFLAGAACAEGAALVETRLLVDEGKGGSTGACAVLPGVSDRHRLLLLRRDFRMMNEVESDEAGQNSA